jgi:hypothetical protein
MGLASRRASQAAGCSRPRREGWRVRGRSRLLSSYGRLYLRNTACTSLCRPGFPSSFLQSLKGQEVSTPCGQTFSSPAPIPARGNKKDKFIRRKIGEPSGAAVISLPRNSEEIYNPNRYPGWCYNPCHRFGRCSRGKPVQHWRISWTW